MKTKELLKTLNKIMPAVEKKTVISQYDHFVFYDGNVSTYNGEIFFSHPVDTELNFSVSAVDMLQVMKTISSDDVELSLESDTLSIKSDDVEASLSTEVHKDSVVQAITTMNLSTINWDKAKEVPFEFIDGISKCLFSVSKDANDIRNLNNIHVMSNVIESADGFRCSEYIMDKEMDDMLIPSDSAIVLTKQEPESYVLSGGWIHFVDKNDVIFSLRTSDGDFPDIGKVLESVDSGTKKVELPDELKSILAQFSSISDGDLDVYKFVLLSIKDGVISCSTNKETCKIKKTMEYSNDKEDFEFYISPVFLNSVMSKTNIVHVNSVARVALFKMDNFTHLVTLPVE